YAPLSAYAFAVETNVYEGIITSSFLAKFIKRALISSAAVQEGAKRAFLAGSSVSSHSVHLAPNLPFPDNLFSFNTCSIASNSYPITHGLLKGINKIHLTYFD